MAWEKAKATRALLRALTSKGDSAIEISIVLVMAPELALDSIDNSVVLAYLRQIDRSQDRKQMGKVIDAFYQDQIKPIIAVKTNLPGFPNCSVLMTRRITGEIRNIIGYSKRFEEQKLVAKRMLIALADIQSILQDGEKTGWLANFHKDRADNGAMFCYAKKTVTNAILGLPIQAMVTIRYLVKQNRAYSINVEGSATYKQKIEKLDSALLKEGSRIIFMAKKD